jgi:ribonuclease P protein component
MNNKDITKVISQSRAFKSGSFLLKIADNTEGVKRNIAYLASKKVFKTSVSRNKVKRRLRTALIKTYKKELSKKLLVFTIFDTIVDKQISEIENELVNVFNKII